MTDALDAISVPMYVLPVISTWPWVSNPLTIGNIKMKSIGLVLTMLIAVLFCNTATFARAPLPDIPMGKGDKCVEPTADMRKNHMEYILHQRDETMHKGIRTSKHSFAECIDCHAVTDENHEAVTYKDERHFCNSCHQYAAVQIDCFDCHTSTPQANSSNANQSQPFAVLFPYEGVTGSVTKR